MCSNSVCCLGGQQEEWGGRRRGEQLRGRPSGQLQLAPHRHSRGIPHSNRKTRGMPKILFKWWSLFVVSWNFLDKKYSFFFANCFCINIYLILSSGPQVASGSSRFLPFSCHLSLVTRTILVSSKSTSLQKRALDCFSRPSFDDFPEHPILLHIITSTINQLRRLFPRGPQPLLPAPRPLLRLPRRPPGAARPGAHRPTLSLVGAISLN